MFQPPFVEERERLGNEIASSLKVSTVCALGSEQCSQCHFEQIAFPSQALPFSVASQLTTFIPPRPPGWDEAGQKQDEAGPCRDRHPRLVCSAPGGQASEGGSAQFAPGSSNKPGKASMG